MDKSFLAGKKVLSKSTLQLELLESRIVFNAVDPVSPTLESSPSSVNDDGEQTNAQAPTAGHGTGCDCGACRRLVNATGQVYFELSPPAPPSSPPVGLMGPEAAPFPTTETFKLHSRPTATRKIYLDFDGHTTTDPLWNSGAPVNTPAFTFEGTSDSFTTNEHLRIQYIWERVAEDFAPFDVDVTTEDPGVAGLTFSGGSDTTWGTRVVIGGNGAWYGSAGGVAYLNTFKFARDLTCFVFTDNLWNDEKNIVDATSHEIGHTLGLSHDGTSTLGYYEGHDGPTTLGWAAIMGVGYYQPITQWSRGEYPDANNSQDDLAIISGSSNGFGYRVDDVGGTTATATPLTITGTTATAAGVIERTTDTDVFSFNSGAGTVSFTIRPYTRDPNLDILAEILDSTGTVIGTSNPVGAMDASFTNFNLPTSGRYYLRVSGVGAGNAATTGYSDYGSLGQYWIDGTIRVGATLAAIESADLAFTENGPALTLTNNLTLASGQNITSATVRITAPGVGDSLLFTNQNGITGSYAAGTGTLTLSGNTTPANYQAALRSVQYANSSNNPTPGTRTISFSVIDAASVGSNSVSRDVVVTAVNDQPTLTAISDLTINEDSGLRTVSLAGIADGDGAGQILTITATSDTLALIPTPNIVYTSPNTTGSLRFTPAANLSGTAVITVTIRDNAGTANGAIDTLIRTFTVTVNPVNDAPSFTKGADLYAIINSPQLTVPNWATNISMGPPDEASQTASFTVTPANPALFSSPPAINSNGDLTFTPAAGATGSTNVQVRIVDNGGTLNGGVNQSAIQTFVINLGINRAPLLNNSGDPLLNPVASGSTISPGTKVADFASGMSDGDLGTSLGVAITNVDSTNGNWHFSINDGVTWTTLNGVTSTNARLLRPNDLVRYSPNPATIGTASLTYHAWDQSSGTVGASATLAATGGNTAFSTANETARVRVAPVFHEVGEDVRSSGNVASAAIATTVTDVELNAKRGIAIIGAAGPLRGRWEYLNGRSWRPLPAVSPSTAFLLRSTDRLRFVSELNQHGEAYLTVRAWDQSYGKPFTVVNLSDSQRVGGFNPYSSGIDYIFARVNPLNDRPVLDVGGVTALPNVALNDNDPAPTTVATLLGSIATDVEPGTIPGIAVTATAKRGTGRWEYQLAGESTWNIITGVSTAKGLLLNPDDLLRYVPDATSLGTATLSFKAWDRSAGTHNTLTNTASTTAFSLATESAIQVISSTVTEPNTAPALDNVAPFVLTGINEDSKPTGTQIATLIGSQITDADVGAKFGIAITQLSGTAIGQWQYSTNNRSWKTISTARPEAALLLRSTDYIRFLPSLNASGSAGFSFQAWDQTRGSFGQFANVTLDQQSGGNGAFSAQVGQASIVITAVNDPPVLNVTPVVILNPISPNETNPVGTLVSKLLGSAVTDADAGAVQGIAITKAASSRGQWQYRLNGTLNFTTITGLSSTNVLYLNTNDEVRFLPNQGAIGVDTISYRAWDQTVGTRGTYGNPTGVTALSRATESASITYNFTEDRPVLDTTPDVFLPAIAMNSSNTPGVLVSQFLGNTIRDVDVTPGFGIAITYADQRNGDWAFTNDGTNWFSLTGVSNSFAVLLRPTDRIRFTPSSNFTGLSTFKYKAWDMSNGGFAGNVSSTSTSGFSTATETASIIVNTAPVLTW